MRIQEVEDKFTQYSTVGRIKVVERAGETLSHKICNKTPWKSLECECPGYVACRSKPGSCKNRNLTYVIQCTECLTKGTIAKYHRETHRTMWDVCRDHINALEKQDESHYPAEY